MPLGDSITLGTPYPPGGGWRYALWKRYSDGYPGVTYTAVGSQNDGPSDLLAANEAHHDGHSGFRIDQITSNVTAWQAANPADVILLGIGTNDCLQAFDTANMGTRLATLLDTILANDASVKVVVAQIPPGSPGTQETCIENYNATIPAIVAARSARVTMTDIHDAMNYVTDIADTIHPNDLGYYKISTMWWNALPR